MNETINQSASMGDMNDSDEDVDVDVGDSQTEQYPLVDIDYNEDQSKNTHAKDAAGLTELETNYQQVEARLRQGCSCLNKCFKALKADAVFKHRLNIAELSKTEHDMYLMGVTVSCLGNRQETVRQKERQKQHPTYCYQGKRVCLEAFSYLENVTQYHLKRIRTHVIRHGVTTRVHGNLGKKPHNAFSLDMYKKVVEFVKLFISEHKTGSTNGPAVIYGESATSCYRAYKQHFAGTDTNFMGYSTFRDFLVKQFPNLKFVKTREKRPKEATPKKSKVEVTQSAVDVNSSPAVRPQNLNNRIEILSNIVVLK